MNPSNRDVVNWAGSVVGIGMVGLLGFAMWALVYHEIPANNANQFTLLIGVLSANVGMVIGFYYGSSSANKTKDATIATLAGTAQTTATNVGITDTANPAVVTTTTTKVTGDTT